MILCQHSYITHATHLNVQLTLPLVLCESKAWFIILNLLKLWGRSFPEFQQQIVQTKSSSTLFIHHAASPSRRSIWSKCHTPAKSKSTERSADIEKKYKHLLQDHWSVIEWFIPCPFPTILNWATNFATLLMASTCQTNQASQNSCFGFKFRHNKKLKCNASSPALLKIHPR